MSIHEKSLHFKEKLRNNKPKLYEKLERIVLKNEKILKSPFIVFLYYFPAYIYAFGTKMLVPNIIKEFGILLILGIVCLVITLGIIAICECLCFMFEEEMIYKDIKGEFFNSLYEDEQEELKKIMEKVQKDYPGRWSLIGKDSLFNKVFYKFSITDSKIQRWILVDKEYNVIELDNKTMSLRKNFINTITSKIANFIYYKMPKRAKKINETLQISSVTIYLVILANVFIYSIMNVFTKNAFWILGIFFIFAALTLFFTYISQGVNLIIADRFYKHENIDKYANLTDVEKKNVKEYIRKLAKECEEYESNFVFVEKDTKPNVSYKILCDNDEVQMTYVLDEAGEFVFES